MKVLEIRAFTVDEDDHVSSVPLEEWDTNSDWNLNPRYALYVRNNKAILEHVCDLDPETTYERALFMQLQIELVMKTVFVKGAAIYAVKMEIDSEDLPDIDMTVEDQEDALHFDAFFSNIVYEISRN